ncbi:MAG: class I SAM-dependent methyltransferase [Gammaproteobacteria bacterium]|nr:class I SAM-dependent methyltransferase [Gammaproteobacteria bacterium]
MQEEETPETPDIETASADYASRFQGRAGQYFLDTQTAAIEDVLSDFDGRSVLDVGGGHGQLTELLLKRNYDVTILSSDERCYERFRGIHPHVNVRQDVGNLLALPYPNQAFDLVISVRLLSHIERWPRLLAEFARVSSRSLVVDYPSKWSLNALTPLLFALKKRIEGNTRTYTSFTAGELAGVLAEHGFAPARASKQFFLPMFVHRALDANAVVRAADTASRAVGLTHLLGSPVILRADRKWGHS